MAGPAVGDRAPEFSLPGTGDRSYSLADERGNVVVLVFYPGDNTPVCTTQLRTYSDEFEQFEGIGAVVWAISPQGVDSHEKFSCKHGGFKFPLLADTDKAVADAYGILGPLKFYRRSVFVVDAAGTVAYAHRAATGITFKPTAELIRAVKAAS
jgi:peroxiredoxin Q/BCP